MEKNATALPGKRKDVFRNAGGVYTVAALGAVLVHAAFFTLISLSPPKREPVIAPKTIEVSLALPSADTGPRPVGMENAPEQEPDLLAGDHQDLPDEVFETSELLQPEVDTNVAVDTDWMKDATFQPSQVDTSGFDLNMPNIPSVTGKSGEKPKAARGGKGGDKSTSRGSSDGQKGGSPANSSGSGGGAVNVPRYKYTPLPPYPARARKEAHEGTVLIAIDVDANGNPTDVKLRTSSGFPELDEATLEHVKARWKFYPAVIDGVPSPSTVVVPVVFNLKNA